jgi:HAD superfamily hydrolase (TIGR01549 family)
VAALPYFECLLLDLDGTLVDSRSLLISSIKCAVKRTGKRVPSAGEILRAYADTTSPGKILRQFKVYDPDEYWRHYVNNVSRIALFDKDIKWKLGEISKAGVRIGLVTSLPKDVVNAILQHFKLSRSFSVVKSYERRAPKWKLIDKAVRELKVDPYRSLYVGDMVADIVAAKRANKDWGIWAGIASWSRKKSLDLSEAEPDFIFQKSDDVTKLMLIRYGSEQDCFGPSESCYVPHEQYLPRRQKIGRESCRY